MFYNNSKNLSALALILAMSFSLADVSRAQGVVTMVDEEVDELGLSDDSGATNNVVNEGVVLENEPVVEESVVLLDEEETLDPKDAADLTVKEEVIEVEAMENAVNDNAIVPVENAVNNVQDDFAQTINDIDALENSLETLTSEEQSALLAPETAPNSGKSLAAQQAEKEAEMQKLTTLGDSVLSQVDNELFTQMSDIEKQTTLLSLELRREKLKSEIAAIKAQRQQAFEKAEEERLEREQRKRDMQTEKEIEKVKELQVLEDKRAAYEVLRQEKALNDYKNKMLENEQKWIGENQRLYGTIQNMEDEKKELIAEFEKKLSILKEESARLIEDAQTAKTEHETVVASLTTQNAQLKKRLEVETSVGTNPFAAGVAGGEGISPEQLNLDYVIMEIRGKGDDLVAKLVNENGESFLVKKGSVLKTGHVVKRITHNYIALENNGIEDYLQFAAGGVVSQEPLSSGNKQGESKPKAKESTVDKRPTLMMDTSIPSLGNGMFVK